jgi:N-methylhydantoinase A
MIPAGVFDRADLRSGDQIIGPALIIEAQTTTLVSTDFSAFIDIGGNIWMTQRQEAME